MCRQHRHRTDDRVAPKKSECRVNASEITVAAARPRIPINASRPSPLGCCKLNLDSQYRTAAVSRAEGGKRPVKRLAGRQAWTIAAEVDHRLAD